MKQTDTIETQLKELEARHKAHQAMLDEHAERKYQRRERHRRGWHKRNHPPITLI